MKTKNCIILVLIFLVLLANTANLLHAQKLPVSYPSPEAASLGIVGNVPVSLYTGRANIAIPLMEVQTGGYKLPVTLSYNSSGVMPDLRPTWVGQNWNLEVGGAITRSIKGLPDEIETYGYGYSYNRLQNSNWYSNEYLMPTLSAPYYLGGSINYYDTEPDEFSFSANGISGKFYMGPNGNFIVASEPGIKVECNFIDSRTVTGATERSFFGFKIITQEGIVYHFGFDDNAIETSGISLQGNAVTKAYVSSWLLTKIEIPNRNEVITFTYSPKKVDTTVSYVDMNIFTTWQWVGGKWVQYNPGCFFSPNQTYISEIYHTYLQSVEGPNFSLSFLTSKAGDLAGFSPEWQKLDSVKLKDKSSQTVKTFIFSYTANSTTRLYLDSVKESGLPAYKFLYNSEKSLGYNMVSTDHWGYYNGFQGGSRIPGTTIVDNKEYFTLDRETDPDNLKAGILTQIKYPTGGTVNFEFEANDYSQYCTLSNGATLLKNVERSWSEWRKKTGDLIVSNPVYVFAPVIPQNPIGVQVKTFINYLQPGTYTVSYFSQWAGYPAGNFEIKYKELLRSSNAYAGGVRIKKISYKDGDSEYSREYKYVKNFKSQNTPTTSSGILGTVPIYNYSINPNAQPLGTTYTGYYDVSTSQPISPLSLAEGSPVGYSEVSEIIKDKSGNSLGYTVYKYTNFDSNPDAPPVSNLTVVAIDYGARNKNEGERGKILSQTDYTNSDVRIKEKSCIYKKIQRDGIKAIERRNIFIPTCIKDITGFTATAYYVNNNSYLPEIETDTIYDTNGNNPVATETSYSYNLNNLIFTSSTKNSDGSKYTTTCTYPTDYSTTYPYNEMIGKNILNPVIEKTTHKVTSTQTVKERNNYDKFQSLFYAPANKQIQYGNNSPETREVYTYDLKDNLRQVTKDNTDNIVYLWGYNYQYPIAEIKGATYTDVKAALGSYTDTQVEALAAKTDPAADMTTINNLRTQLPNALVTTYTYKPLVGVATMTDPRGVIAKYDYDSFGRLIKVTQADKVIETYDYHYKGN